jgi:hypothetical protein
MPYVVESQQHGDRLMIMDSTIGIIAAQLEFPTRAASAARRRIDPASCASRPGNAEGGVHIPAARCRRGRDVRRSAAAPAALAAAAAAWSMCVGAPAGEWPTSSFSAAARRARAPRPVTPPRPDNIDRAQVIGSRGADSAGGTTCSVSAAGRRRASRLPRIGFIRLSVVARHPGRPDFRESSPHARLNARAADGRP